MTIKERLEYAEAKLNESIENEKTNDFINWRGCRYGVKRAVEVLEAME